MVNLSLVKFETNGCFLLYHFLYLKVNLYLIKTNELDEFSPNFIFTEMNIDPIVIEKKNELMVNLDLTILLKR